MSGNKKLGQDKEELYRGRRAAPAARQRFLDLEVTLDVAPMFSYNSDTRYLVPPRSPSGRILDERKVTRSVEASTSELMLHSTPHKLPRRYHQPITMLSCKRKVK